MATSDRQLDDPIADFARKEGVAVFRGSASDVLGRCLACASERKWTYLMRISGDSPFFDPVLASRMASDVSRMDCDIVTNVAVRTFPPGNSIEIVATRALARLASETIAPPDREHVTTYLYRHAGAFELHSVTAPDDRYAGVTLTIDREEDIAMAEWIAARLEPPLAVAPFEQIVKLRKAWTPRGVVH